MLIDHLPNHAEWDFRLIPEDQIGFACIWEHLRSFAGKKSMTPKQVVDWLWHGAGPKMKTASQLCPRVLAGDLDASYIQINHEAYRKITADDFINLATFVSKFKRRKDPVSQFLWGKFPTDLKQQLQKRKLEPGVSAKWLEYLNAILSQNDFYDADRFSHVGIRQAKLIYHQKRPKIIEEYFSDRPNELFRNNKIIFKAAFARELVPASISDVEPLYWYALPQKSLKISMRDVKSKIFADIKRGNSPKVVIERNLKDHQFLFEIRISKKGTKAIVDDFKKWVDELAETAPAPRTGKKASAGRDRLKWLSAYRLQQSVEKGDFELEELLKMLVADVGIIKLSGANRVYPAYKIKKIWDAAVKKAEQMLSDFEGDPIGFEQDVL